MIRILLTGAIVLSAIASGQQVGEQNFRISGTVVNALTGAPLADTEVAISQQRGDVRTIRTGGDGRFIFEDVKAGKYWLGAQHRGFKMQGYEEHDNFSTAIVVAPRLNSQDLVFRLKPNGVISGTVTDEQNEPVRSAKVMLFRRSSYQGKMQTDGQGETGTDDLGHYRFSGLKPGTYFVIVSAQPWYRDLGFIGELSPEGKGDRDVPQYLNVAYPFTYFPGVTEESQAQAISLATGERFVADIALSPAPAVKVTIKGVAKGSGAMLNGRVFGQTVGGPPGEGQISQGEDVIVTGIPDGHFVLSLASVGSDGLPENTREMEIDVSGDTEITGASAAPSVSVSGTCVLEDGSSLPERSGVVLRNIKSGQELLTQIMPNGKFEFGGQAVGRGTYELAVNTWEDMATKSVRARGARVDGREIEIPESGSVQITLTLSRGLGQVTGTAVKEGKPFAGAMIVLIPDQLQNAMLFRRDQSDSDGTFKLARVVPGRYRLIAIEDGWDLEWLKASVLAKYLSKATPVEVAGKGQTKFEARVQEK